MLNEAKGNMYDFVTHTWNTVKGACPHDCAYCYMKRFGKQRPARFDKKELKTDIGEGNFIFVGSSCDMWAEDIPENWIDWTLDCVNQFDNQYLFQTKNPSRFWDSRELPATWPTRCVLCTTIETNREYPAIMGKTPTPRERSTAMKRLKMYRRYVTVEPIMAFDLAPMVEIIKRCEPVQVNIGADSGGNNLPEPNADDIVQLMVEVGSFAKVVLKPNVKRLLVGTP